MKRTLLVISLAFAGCSPVQPEHLGSCWRSTDFEVGQRVTGEAVALYNPTGALIITSACRQGQLLANFIDADLQQAAFREMQSRSLGQWHGGQGYLVSLEGVIADRDQREGPSHININRFSVTAAVRVNELIE